MPLTTSFEMCVGGTFYFSLRLDLCFFYGIDVLNLYQIIKLKSQVQI